MRRLLVILMACLVLVYPATSQAHGKPNCWDRDLVNVLDGTVRAPVSLPASADSLRGCGEMEPQLLYSYDPEGRLAEVQKVAESRARCFLG